jgi:hypothetical protein
MIFFQDFHQVLLPLGSRPMKMFDNNPCSFTAFLLIFFLASCGDDHAGDNHSGSGHDSDSHAPKSQENLLTMLEETDSPHGETSVHAPIASKHESDESADHGASSSAHDLEALLGGEPPVAGEPAHGAESSDHGQLEPTISATHSEATEDFFTSPNKDLEDLLSKLNNSKIIFEGQLATLKKMVEQRDETINSLKLINQQLRNEVKRLRKTSPGASGNLPINGEIQVLRDDLLKLKNTFTLKVKELDELREYNKELLNRLDNLEPAAKRAWVSPPPANVNPTRESTNVVAPDHNLDKLLPDLPVVAPLRSSGKVLTASPPTGSLDFDAVVTAANGKIKEAFYTEFFIAKSDLHEILENAGINLDNPKYKNISSHAELWAQSRKYPFRYPDLQKDIRKTLLDSIDDEKSPGRRIRTDIDGNSGAITSLVAGSYFIIGTASLGQVGVTWSVPVNVKSGRNKVSLTIANASWSL